MRRWHNTFFAAGLGLGVGTMISICSLKLLNIPTGLLYLAFVLLVFAYLLRKGEG